MDKLKGYLQYEGQTFGRLVAVKALADSTGRPYIYCRCICGNMRLVDAYNLSKDKVKSCGCYRDEKTRIMNSKITPEMSSEIIKLKATGMSLNKIADRMGVSRTSIYYHCKSNQQAIDDYKATWNLE